MLQSLRERLTLVLLCVLPFHAFLVTFGTLLLAGPGHAPLTMLALWKEALLLLVLLIALVEAVGKLVKLRIENGKLKINDFQIDVIDSLIVALVVLAIAVSMFNSQFSILNSQFIYGFKYDFVPLIAFVALRRVAWSPGFVDRLLNTLLGVAGVVSAIAIIALYLPQEFFVRLGYSDLHSLYQADGPLAAFQQIGGTSLRRAQSTMSGPNQLGLWLLIPLGMLLARATRENVYSFIRLFVYLLILTALVLTLSRSALLAAAIMVGVVLWQQLSRKRFLQFAAGLLIAAALLGFAAYTVAPEVIVRAASTSDHISRPIAALRTIIAHPLGLGLGTAGPASNRVSDTCVYVDSGGDATWAADRPDLCVFIGETQVQPEAPCICPVLPENWYLQIGVELGVLGMLMYILLVLGVLQKLYELKMENGKLKMESSIFNLQSSIFLAFLGLSIAAMFLHAWEDAAVAYTLWVMAAMRRR